MHKKEGKYTRNGRLTLRECSFVSGTFRKSILDFMEKKLYIFNDRMTIKCK